MHLNLSLPRPSKKNVQLSSNRLKAEASSATPARTLIPLRSVAKRDLYRRQESSDKKNDPPRRTPRRVEFNGAGRDRTDDLLHAMQALSQLSYGPSGWLHPALPGKHFLRVGVAREERIPPTMANSKDRRDGRGFPMPMARQGPEISPAEASESSEIIARGVGRPVETKRVKNSRIRSSRSIRWTGSPLRLRSCPAFG